jgi:hypothetical protein
VGFLFIKFKNKTDDLETEDSKKQEKGGNITAEESG